MSSRKKLESGTYRRPKTSLIRDTPPEHVYELDDRDSDVHASKLLSKLTDTASESQELNRSRESVVSSPDIYTQLAQKDKDLILAAELGKALLERNEELTRANERITEEYSHKLEVRASEPFPLCHMSRLLAPLLVVLVCALIPASVCSHYVRRTLAARVSPSNLARQTHNKVTVLRSYACLVTLDGCKPLSAIHSKL